MTLPTHPATPRTRLAPDARREQLIDLGVRLLATHSLDELSIDLLTDAGGISRGLLYHYFGGKQGFHEAVVRRAAQDLVEQTAPPDPADVADPVARLHASVAAYLDYVTSNRAGYLSLVRAAAGGNDTLKQIYEDARAELTDRTVREGVAGGAFADSPTARLLVRGWVALAEELVLTWIDDPHGIEREALLAVVTAALPALTATTD